MTEKSNTAGPRRVSGRASRFASALFSYGNIAAVFVPIPLGFLWIGASIIVYAMNIHHADPKVRYYTQQAGHGFYGITGAFVVIASAFPGHALRYYLVSWAIAAVLRSQPDKTTDVCMNLLIDAIELWRYANQSLHGLCLPGSDVPGGK